MSRRYETFSKDYKHVYGKMDQNHGAKMVIARKMWTDMCGMHHGIPDPPTWLFNQEKMRTLTEQFGMMPHDMMKYFKYMYDSFPPGYKDVVMAEYKTS